MYLDSKFEGEFTPMTINITIKIFLNVVVHTTTITITAQGNNITGITTIFQTSESILKELQHLK